MEISCSEKVTKALCVCADRMQFDVKPQENLIYAQTIETLSRSLEMLYRIKEEGAEE